MHPFSTPWKDQETLLFSDVFRVYRKFTLGKNGLKRVDKLANECHNSNLMFLQKINYPQTSGKG